VYGREDQSEKILGRAMAIPIRTRIYPLKACISGLQSEVRVLSGRAVRMVHAMTSYKKVPWKEGAASSMVRCALSESRQTKPNPGPGVVIPVTDAKLSPPRYTDSLFIPG